MRRRSGGFEVEIKAPTLGLVTRLSPDEPDVRAAVAASNVRFEKGVARNAPGYATVVAVPDLDTPANMIFQARYSDRASDVGIVATAGSIFLVRPNQDASLISSFTLLESLEVAQERLYYLLNYTLHTDFPG